MEENKTEQYTFGPDEKDTLEILAFFEQELDRKLEESKSEVEKVKYYETFKINEINFKNIFITTEKDAEGNITYHVYCGDSSNEIIAIDPEGKVEIKNSELAQFLGDVDLEKIIEENEQDPGKLKGISEKADPEELQRAIEKEDEHGNKQKQEDEEEKEDDEQEEEKEDDETKAIDKDLKQQGEDLRISSYRKIKDSHISERMPEVFANGTENGIAFSNKLNRFVIISKVNGQYQLNENVEPARMTWRTIISISPDGQQVERKVPHALMQLPNNSEKEIAVTLDEYGDASIETVNVLPCQERIARAVREEGEGLEGEETFEMRREFETEGIQYEHDIAHNVKDIEQAQRDANKTVDYNITPDDYIPNTGMTWSELMDDTGESLPKLIERYNREITKDGADANTVIDIIEQDYGNVNRQRQY